MISWREIRRRLRNGAGLTAVVLALAAALLPAKARAQSCWSNGSLNLNFGTIDVLSGGPYYTSGVSNFTCTAGTPTNFYFCLSVGTGTAGTPTNRLLTQWNGTLAIQIKPSAASPTQIGNGTSYPMDGPLVLSHPGGWSHSSYSVPVTVVVPTPQNAPPSNNGSSYYSNFGGNDFGYYWTMTPASSCQQVIASASGFIQSNMFISAMVQPTCGVTATPMNFGTQGALTAAVAATAIISVTCNTTTAVTVALDNGATGSGPTARKMLFGSNAVTYGIYQDAAGTTPWGSAANATVAATASTTPVSLTAYGIVPAQPTPPPGTYTDVVNVVVNY
jgi:spore coat protein U-like protein